MKNYYGYQSDLIVGSGTKEEFQKQYKELAYHPEKLVKASTIIPVNENNFNWFIFFDIKELDKREINNKTGKIELKL